LASTAGLGLGGYGAWKLVHHLYKKHREAKAQEELQDAEQGYLSGLQREHALNKQANTEGSGFSKSTMGWGLLTGSLLATALGGGIAAHKLLSKKYPIYKPKDDWELENLSEMPVDYSRTQRKMATETGVWPGRPRRAEVLEHLIRLGLQDKRAHVRDCGFKDLSCAAAAGRTQELKQAVHTGGVNL
jgi:hypothetical protein